jgi:hypothetical protein
MRPEVAGFPASDQIDQGFRSLAIGVFSQHPPTPALAEGECVVGKPSDAIVAT